MTVSALGDAAILISAGERTDRETSRRANAIAAAIARERPAGVVDVVSAFGSIAVFYDFRSRVIDFPSVQAELEAILQRVPEPSPAAAARRVEIPVCYGGEFGPDLEVVAQRAGMAREQVVALHAGASYWVDAIGFAPGFPYLGGLPESLATPRRATPRPLVPAGSVGIGGSQTGVYPFATPGGWNLIGRTPRRLFDATQEVPALLCTGDEVIFRPIDAAEFTRAAEEEEAAVEPFAPEPAGEGSGLRVLRPGMFTTVQDFGRLGHRASGVPASGAADSFALRVANLLVGNPPEAAALEFTLKGPLLQFSHDAVVALMGGDFGLPRGRPRRVRAGEVLNIGAAATGCRGYLAVAGGIDVPPVLGSRSTYTRGRFGGWQGTALREGDWVPAKFAPRQFSPHWHMDERIAPAYSPRATVRVVAGAHADEFPAAWLETDFKVSVQSDRMGLRLEGRAVERRPAAELRSAPVTPGTIQIPPSGQPIVLLADAQTIGGYPRIAHVITVDLPIVAQLRPSDTVRFQAVSLAEAQALLVARERALARLREGLAQKLA